MATFERSFKDKFRAQMLAFMPTREIIVSNDMNFDLLKNNPEAVVAVIHTGPGQKSGHANYDLTSLPISIAILCRVNAVQEILGAMNNLIGKYDGQWAEVTLSIYDPDTKNSTDKVFRYKPTYVTPIPSGGVQALAGVNGTIEATALLMSVSVVYSNNSATEPEDMFLKVGNTLYPIHFSAYSFSDHLATVPALFKGELYPTQKVTNLINAYQFTILLAAEGLDPFCDLLHNEFWQQGSAKMFHSPLKLYRGPDTVVDIQTYTINESYVNGATVINLTLSR